MAADIGDAGAIDHILDTMQRHLAASGVQHGGCAALAGLCIAKCNLDAIKEKSVMPIVLAGMDAHLGNHCVQQTGLYAICTFAQVLHTTQ